MLDSHAKLDAWHRKRDHVLQKYLHVARAGSQRLDRAARLELDPSAAQLLPANNLAARTAYAEIVDRHVTAHLRRRGATAPLFWVTLVAEQFTMGLGAAAGFNPRRLMAWTRTVLGPCHFVGVVEAALYTNVKLVFHGRQRAVSWHVHLLLWGPTAAEVAARRADLNRRFRTFLPGVAAAHVAPITLDQLTAKSCYMLKTPFTDYRIYARRREHVDWETGEVTTVATGRFTQKKRDLRPGDMTRLCRILAGRSIDQLTFATGDGRAVLADVNREALARFHAWERRQPWYRHR